jgi:NifU-like protein
MTRPACSIASRRLAKLARDQTVGSVTPAEQLDDHHRKPRNLGKLLNASVSGDIGSIVAGDALRFYLKVEDGRISQARFQVFNASDQVAAASVVTELALGKTLDEALALRPTDVCNHLGGLDPGDLPVQVWGLEGLRAAIAVHRGELPEADEELEAVLCRCHGIPEETVRQSIAVMGLTEVQAVVDATGAGTGCGSCRSDIPRLLADKDSAAAKPAEPRKAGPSGRIPTLMKIQRLVADQIQPQAQIHGGKIELWDFDGTVVTVSVSGVDDDRRRLLLGQLETALKAEIAPGLGVRER